MIYINGRLSGKPTEFKWTTSKTESSGDITALKITLWFHGYSSPYEERELARITHEAIAASHGGWLATDGLMFEIDCNKLREAFDILKEQTWLNRVVKVRPRFTLQTETRPSLSYYSPAMQSHGHDVTTYPATIDIYLDERVVAIGEGSTVVVPQEIRASLEKFRHDHPEENRTGFIIMRFGETDAHSNITKAIKSTLTDRGMEGVRSDDKQYHDDLLYNVLTYVYGCGFAVAVFERIESDDFNPNVSLEVGYIMALGKEVCLLKDKTLKTLQTDLVGKLYTPFDPQNAGFDIKKRLTKWIADKGLA